MRGEIQSPGFPFWRLLRGSVQLWVGVIFFIVGMVFTVIGLQTAGTEHVYQKKGLTVDAKVLGKTIERAKRGEHSRTRYLVHYDFLSEQGQKIDSETEVMVEEWENLEAGNVLKVLYLPDAPEMNRSQNDTEWIAALVFIAVGGVFALIGGGLAFFDLRSVLRAVRLSQNGFLANATVLRAESTNTTINRVAQWCIYYRYHDHLGHEQEGASHLLPPEEGMLWKTGDTGAVRYDEHSPSISVWIGTT